MHLIDRNPGVFFGLCAVVLYTTIGLECGMLVSSSYVIMGVTMLVIIGVAVGLVRFMSGLLGDESGDGPAPAPARQPRRARSSSARAAAPTPGASLSRGPATFRVAGR